MSEENNAAEAVETPTVESLQASLAKAEAKIVDLKRTETKASEEKKEEKEEEKSSFWKEEVEKMIANAIKEKAINNQEEQFKQNQNETNTASITTEDPVTTSWFQSISVSEYSNLTPQAQREYMKTSLDKTWEIVLD